MPMNRRPEDDTTEADLRVSHKFLAERLGELRDSVAEMQRDARNMSVRMAVIETKAVIYSGAAGILISVAVNLLMKKL